MESLLFVKNNYEIDPELLKQLRKEFALYISSNTFEAFDVVNDHCIFIIMIDHSIDEFTRSFLEEIYNARSLSTPIIFISKNPSEDFKSEVNRNSGWNLVDFPINQQEFMLLIKNEMRIAIALNEKIISLEKNGMVYIYNVRNISRIERSRRRYIKVYCSTPTTFINEEEEFYFDEPLYNFPTKFNIQDRIKHIHQSWLVNTSYIARIRKSDREIDLNIGITLPLSLKFMKNLKI